MEILKTVLTTVGAGLVRNIAGWLENAMQDGEITSYEWGQLGATVFRVTLLGIGAAFGLGLDPLAASGSAIVADYIISAIKKKK